jgi:hypothetical protein
MQFTTLNDIRVYDQGKLRTVSYTGTVQELTYTVERYVSQYIPVTRFRNADGPEVPSLTGTTQAVSNAVFGYPLDRQTLELVGAQLQSNNISATSRLGL